MTADRILYFVGAFCVAFLWNGTSIDALALAALWATTVLLIRGRA